jgi:hypothetical protein
MIEAGHAALKMREEFTLGASGPDECQYFEIDTGFIYQL